jgi:choline-sulfatase
MNAPRPNILVFMSDDHGQWALPCYGNREIVAPTLNWLASTGARFDNAYTPCPVCSPARASFFTGTIPSAHGVHDYIHELGVGQNHPGIEGQTTLAMRLHEAGYQTGLCGKWHLNHFRRKPAGFDTWFTMAKGTNARFGRQDFYEDDLLVSHYGHQATAITDRSLQFLRERDRQRPFFLFVGYTNTHTPHTGEPDRLVALYDRARFDDVPREPFDECHGFARIPWSEKQSLAQYYAAVTMIDEQAGRIVDELQSQQDLDNTLIVYTSDHGHMNGHHGLHSKGNATIPQNFLDESIRVPLLVRWPGQIAAGTVQTQFVDHCDLHATLCDVAGAKTGDGPGQSLWPVWRHETVSWRDWQICEYGNARMIRTEAGKLIRRYPGPNGSFGDEYYDLRRDPRERCNVIGQTEVATLAGKRDESFARYERADRSGRNIATQPVCNSSQPWVLTPEEVAMRPEGSK